MNRKEMLDRTREFALRVVKLVAAMPGGRVGDVLGRQVLKSGTSIGANYREAIRASSKRHFITTLEIVQREAEETNVLVGSNSGIKDVAARSTGRPYRRVQSTNRNCDCHHSYLEEAY